MKKNPFISFYGKHGISPVHQDLRNFRVHLSRREKLYRMLGLAPVAFKDKVILEVGPGGGYNSLAIFCWGVDRIDFVEPNPTAQKELPQTLAKYGISRQRWRLFPCVLEDLAGKRRYDVILAEGFIPGLYTRKHIISRLKCLVSPGGVVVVTCVDEISFLLELVKRLVARRLLCVSKVEPFEKKVSILSRAFCSHLQTLKYASRPVEDWVTDQFINPALYGKFFSIADAVKEFGCDFTVLGSSPSMFIDCSWYKDTDFDSRGDLLRQFSEKRHILLSKDMKESARPAGKNNDLAKAAHRLRMFAAEVEDDLTGRNLSEIIRMFKRVEHLTAEIDVNVSLAIREAILLLRDKKLTDSKISSSRYFSSAFGRGQQWISLVKKFTK